MERGSWLKMFLQGFSKELRSFLIMEGTSLYNQKQRIFLIARGLKFSPNNIALGSLQGEWKKKNIAKGVFQYYDV